MNPLLEQHVQDFDEIWRDLDSAGDNRSYDDEASRLQDCNELEKLSVNLGHGQAPAPAANGIIHDELSDPKATITSPALHDRDVPEPSVYEIWKTHPTLCTTTGVLAVGLAMLEGKGWLSLQLQSCWNRQHHKILRIPILYLFGIFVMGVVWVLPCGSHLGNNGSRNTHSPSKEELDKDEAHSAPETNRTQQQKQHECRMELSKLLGAAGAPLLAKHYDNIVGQSSSATTLQQGQIPEQHQRRTLDDGSAVLVEFARGHMELVQTMEIAMNIIKMATSLKLKASSRTVERVERAMYGRSKRTTLRQRPVSFATLRNVVAQALIHQTRILESIFIYQRQNKQYHARSDWDFCLQWQGETSISLEVAQGSLVIGSLPDVITLSWIRSSKREFLVLLSHVLHELTQGSSLDFVQTNQRLFRNSICLTQEFRHHIAAAMGLEDVDNNFQCNGTYVKGVSWRSNKSKLIQSLDQTRAQMHAIYVSLWAMGDSLLQSTNQGGVALEATDDEDEVIVDDNTKDWFARVQELSLTANAMLKKLEADFIPLAALNDNQPEDTDTSAALVTSTVVDSSNVQDFTVDSPLESHIRPFTAITKTAVFSGQGSVGPTKLRHAIAEPSSGVNTATTLQTNPVVQHVLLNELRDRLQSLQLPEEEHGPTSDKHVQDKCNSDSNGAESNNKTRATPLFLGATGSLLSELKDTITMMGNKNKEENTFS